MQLYCTTKPLEWWSGPLGAGPSKQLPCPWEGQQHSAQSSAALSSYSSESQEFIWMKLKVSRIWLPSLQLSNLIHERDSHALAEKDKQDAATRVTRMKEIVSNSSLPVLRSPPPHVHSHGRRPNCVWMSHSAATPWAQRSWSQINVESSEQRRSTCSVSKESNNDVFECVCDTAVALCCQSFLLHPKARTQTLDGKHTAAIGGVVKLNDPCSWWWDCASLTQHVWERNVHSCHKNVLH